MPPKIAFIFRSYAFQYVHFYCILLMTYNIFFHLFVVEEHVLNFSHTWVFSGASPVLAASCMSFCLHKYLQLPRPLDELYPLWLCGNLLHLFLQLWFKVYFVKLKDSFPCSPLVFIHVKYLFALTTASSCLKTKWASCSQLTVGALFSSS